MDVTLHVVWIEIQMTDCFMGTDSPHKIIGTDSQVLLINRAGDRRK